MADNYQVGGLDFASDDVTGIQVPRVKVMHGEDGSAVDASATNPLPTALLGDPVDFWPGYSGADSNELRRAMVDDGGALVTRGAVTTDEGTFRVNFANTSIAVSLGSCTLSGLTVTGNGFNTADVSIGDHFKFDADPDSAWMQIASIDSNTQLTLAAPYTGGATSGAASRSLVAVNMQNGASYAVANGQLTLSSGTTTGASAIIGRVSDYAPIVYRTAVSISQRIANQATRIGFAEPVTAGDPRWFARFVASGTDASVLICESARNPTQAPSAAETQTTTVRIPHGRTTASMLEYRVEVLTERVLFYIDNIRVAEHTRTMPSQHDIMAASVRLLNTGTAASSTNVVVDYMTTKNHNKLEIGVMSDSESIVMSNQVSELFQYTQAGVIAVNTILMQFDCLRYRQVIVRAVSVGTSGVITPEWSEDGTNWDPAVGFSVSSAGQGYITTFNSPNRVVIPVFGRFLRLRLSTATTGGTTTINAQAYQQPVMAIPNSIAVTGTLTANIGTGSLAAGTNMIGDVGMQVRTSSAGGELIHHIVSAASTNAANVKASAGRLYGWNLSNNTATWQYVKLHNTASAPTAGAGVVMTIGIPPGGSTTRDFARGVGFTTGIGRTIVTGAADADATATTLNAVVGDLFFA